MVYINLEEAKNENTIKSKICKLFYKFSKLKENIIVNKIIINIRDVDNNTLNKLSHYFKEKCINRVCISNNLIENDIFFEFIKKEKIKVFDGRWLFKHLVIKIAEYIVSSKKEKIEYQEISFLSNNIDMVLANNIKELASKVKVLNIITNNECKFRKIEKELYEEKGIILNMNNNYKKSLLKSDIIFNFDFSEEELNKYLLPDKTCIVNLRENINVKSKAFSGINTNFYDITLPRKYINNLVCFNNFSIPILYESFIYKNTNPSNILKELDEDNVNIIFLIGKNGKIRRTEYSKMSKKMAN